MYFQIFWRCLHFFTPPLTFFGYYCFFRIPGEPGSAGLPGLAGKDGWRGQPGVSGQKVGHGPLYISNIIH